MNIDSLLKQIHPVLKQGLADLAKAMDEVFTELAKNTDATERQVIQDCLKDFHQQKPQIDSFLIGKLKEQLFELSGKDASKLKEDNKKLITAADLRLVEESDLEKQVALESLASKVLNKVALELNKLTQRLNHSFKRSDMDEKTNPLGPALFCHTFGLATQTINTSIEYRLFMYKQFDRTLLAKLNLVLETANAELSRQGILPDVVVVHKSTLRSGPSGGAKTASSPAPAETGGGNLGAGGGSAPAASGASGAVTTPSSGESTSGGGGRLSMFDIADPIVKQIYDLVAKDGYSVLQKLISESNVGDSRITSDGIRDNNFQAKEEIKDTELLDILTTLQTQTEDSKQEFIPADGEFKRVSIAQNVGQALQVRSEQAGQDTALSKTGNDVVNLVDMLFDFILSDDYLSPTIKSVIADLQVPLTKVALLDKTFFSDSQHPARLLLNELSRAGMAVPSGAEVLQDQTYKNISGTVQKITHDFNKETEVFSEVLEDFNQKLEAQNKRSQMLEHRLHDMEKGRAKTEHAEEMVSKLLNKMLATVPVSTEVEEFLQTGWRDVLMMTCLKFGSHSKQWKADNEITRKLMKSILLAKKARLDDKRMKVPMDLLKLLKLGLDRISYDPLETKRLLSGLAKNYQIIANTSPEDVKADLLHLAGTRGEVVPGVVIDAQASDITGSDGKKTVSETQVMGAQPQDIFKTTNKEFAEKIAGKMSATAKKSLSNETQPVAEQEPVSVQEVEEKIKRIDKEIFKAIDAEDEEKFPDHEFVAGNPWYDMVKQLPVGVWVELKQEGTELPLRCKLVANIKTLEKLIFVNKTGVKVAERKMPELAEALKKQEARVINDNMIFDQALESVIVHLRAKA